MLLLRLAPFPFQRTTQLTLHSWACVGAGRAVRPLAASEVQQIAGRAGRYSSDGVQQRRRWESHPDDGDGQDPHEQQEPPAGRVTCLHAADLPALHAAMAESPLVVQHACLMPRRVSMLPWDAQQGGTRMRSRNRPCLGTRG